MRKAIWELMFFSIVFKQRCELRIKKSSMRINRV